MNSIDRQEAALFWMKTDAMSEDECIKLIIETYKNADENDKVNILTSVGVAIMHKRNKIKKREYLQVIK